MLKELAQSVRGHRARAERLLELTKMEDMISQPRYRDGVRPIFIVGAPRSGTSILTWALGQHPNIQTMPETAWIAALATGSLLAYRIGSDRGPYSHLSNVQFPFAPFMRRIGEAVDVVVHDVYEERCHRLYGDYRAQGGGPLAPAGTNPRMQVRRRADDPKTRWVDGTPLNSDYIWALAQMFPEARFLHNLRRPEEVVASLESFDAAGGEPQTLAEGIETWVRHTENAWLGERALGSTRVFRVDFRRLREEPERLCEEILQFLGETPHPDCAEPFADRINSSQTDAKLAATIARLQGMKQFRAAERLYEALMESGPAGSPDEEAATLLRQRFLDLAASRSLL